MSEYVYASLIVSAADQKAAQDLLSPDYFVFPLSADGSPPATHYVSSGPFSSAEMDTAMNQTAVAFWVHFGMEPDYNGMMPVVEPIAKPKSK